VAVCRRVARTADSVKSPPARSPLRLDWSSEKVRQQKKVQPWRARSFFLRRDGRAFACFNVVCSSCSHFIHLLIPFLFFFLLPFSSFFVFLAARAAYAAAERTRRAANAAALGLVGYTCPHCTFSCQGILAARDHMRNQHDHLAMPAEFALPLLLASPPVPHRQCVVRF
jgi:hypothetical protein